MNRLARVVAQGKNSVTIQLQRTEKCSGCTSNCNQPLFNLFGMKKNVLTLSQHNKNYLIDDKNHLLSQKLTVGQPLTIQISEHDLFRYSGLLYLLPLIICLIMISAGYWFGDWIGANSEATSLIGLAVGFLMVFLFFKKDMFGQHLKFRPIVTILENQGTNR
jgi:positive regulator of sigma E activity